VTATPDGGDPPVLALRGVTRRFGEVTALDRLDLDVASGEVVGLLGHNGAGKTTTVRLLAGLLAADDGTVRVAGRDPVVEGPEVRRAIGVLPSAPVVDDRLTGVQNLRFVADVFGLPRHGLDDRIAAALAAFELDGRGGERVAGYSTGMRQRLSLARVLLPEPPCCCSTNPPLPSTRSLLGRSGGGWPSSPPATDAPSCCARTTCQRPSSCATA
jgi:ABC-type multidrug transport system ATPase subunit